MPVDTKTLGQASAFVRGLRARGGTEMLAALQIALAGERESKMMRQIVFLTDGAIGNEDAVLRLVHDYVGDRRLFTIGIGPAPNTFFLTKAAQYGRGSFTFIGDVREVREKMTALFRKLETPAMTNIAVEWPGASDAWPRLVPDLYAGEPIVVTAQFPAGTSPGKIAINAKHGLAQWHAELPFDAKGHESGVGVLWARAKIDALMDAQRHGAPEQDIRPAVIDIALTHHLVSKYTSLVAVDVTPSRPAGVDAVKMSLPGNVPQGSTRFAQLPRTATPAALSMIVGALLLLLASTMILWMRQHALRQRVSS
jgi:Ca-activated chloride channel family protein